MDVTFYYYLIDIMSKFKKLLGEFGIDETFTKPPKKETVFTKVKDIVYPKQDYNYMADLLFLPTTKEGYKYALTVVDLWSDEFDIEPLKTKQPKEVLSAFKRIFKRPYLNKPKGSIQTDSGNEFKGVFQKYLFKQNILKKTALPNRHSQMANIERLNRTLGRFLNGYMNEKEKQLKIIYREWTDILDELRVKLNKIRKKPDGDPYALPEPEKEEVKPEGERKRGRPKKKVEQKLISTEKEVNGRFTLHSTQNIYTFILLDQIEGKMWQVQWSTKLEDRGIIPIE